MFDTLASGFRYLFGVVEEPEDPEMEVKSEDGAVVSATAPLPASDAPQTFNNSVWDWLKFATTGMAVGAQSYAATAAAREQERRAGEARKTTVRNLVVIGVALSIITFFVLKMKE